MIKNIVTSHTAAVYITLGYFLALWCIVVHLAYKHYFRKIYIHFLMRWRPRIKLDKIYFDTEEDL